MSIARKKETAKHFAPKLRAVVVVQKKEFAERERIRKSGRHGFEIRNWTLHLSFAEDDQADFRRNA